MAQHRPGSGHDLMMAGAMIFTVWGWSHGRFTPGDVVFVNTMLLQLFRPLDMLGWVYRSIRQGLIDMEAMWKLVDTRTEVTDVPNAAPLHVKSGNVRIENVRFRLRERTRDLKGARPRYPGRNQLRDRGPIGRGQVDHRAITLSLL